MASPYKYHVTAKAVMEWANSELEHVGRIAACEDKNIQYSYALSTVNGTAHLKDALYELVNDSNPGQNTLRFLTMIVLFFICS